MRVTSVRWTGGGRSEAEAPRVASAEPGGGRQAFAFLVSALALVALALAITSDVFWATDEGYKFLEVHGFQGPATGLSLEIPAAVLDPGHRFLPFGWPEVHLREGRAVCFYAPWFPLISVPGYRFLGLPGLLLLPLFGSLATLAVLGLVLREVGLGGRASWVFPVFAVGTPLLPYGITFWEHSLSVFASLLGLLLLARNLAAGHRLPNLLAGLSLAAGTALREEGYVLTASALIVLVVFRRFRAAAWLATAYFVALTPVWLAQVHLTGSPLGLHARVYDELQRPGEPWARLVEKLGDVRFYLTDLGASPALAASLAVAIAGVAVVGLLPSTRSAGRVTAALLVAAAACGIATTLLLADPEPVLAILFAQGLFPHVPVTLLALGAARRLLWHPRAGVRFLAGTSAVFLALICFLLHRRVVGLLWGPRHFFPILPVLLVLSAVAFADLSGEPLGVTARRTLRGVTAALVALGLLVQAHGLRTVVVRKQALARLTEAARETGRIPLLADGFWLTPALSALYFDRLFLGVRSGPDLVDALELLARNGYERALLVRSSRYGALKLADLQRVADRVVSFRKLAAPGVSPLDVQLMVLRTSVRPPDTGP